MLAWYVSGRLSEAERREIEAAPDLRREVAEFQLLRSVVAEVAPEEPRFPPNLVQDAWRQIQAFEREKAAAAEARLGARLGRFFDAHIASLWRGATGVGRLALATQLGLVFLLGMSWTTWLGGPGERQLPPRGDGYSTQSGPPEPVPPPRPEPGGGGIVGGVPGRDLVQLRVKVMFAPEASQQAVGALLRRLDAQIVDGPSSLGLYTVAVEGPADEAARASALRALASALEAEPTVVRGVVPEAP
jgi:hypothetical protein